MADQIIYLYTSLSPRASIDTGPEDFPVSPGVVLDDGTILYTWKDDPLKTSSSGTGIFDPFLTIQRSDSQGGTNLYNGDDYATGDAISSSTNRTSLLEISKVPVVGIGGMQYLEIRLDINEVGGGGGQRSEIVMTDLKIYGSNDSSLTSFNGLTPLYSLDTDTLNSSVYMWDDYKGSGRSDVVMLIPKSYFESNPTYLYFQANFDGTDGGFEEFSTLVLQAPLNPAVEIAKTADVLNADRSPDEDDVAEIAGDILAYTVSATNVGEVALTNPVLTDALILQSLDRNVDGIVNAEDIVSGDTNGNGLMDIGETWVWQGEYVVSQDDLDIRGNYDGPDPGEINDSIIRNDVAIITDEGASASAAVDSRLEYSPLVIVEKLADVLNPDGTDDADDLIDNAGDVIQYSINVSNDGNITLRDLVLNDPLINEALDKNSDGVVDVLDSTGGDDGNGLLDVGETWNFSGSYIVTQADIDARGNYDELGDGTNDDVILNIVSVDVQTLDQTLNVTSRVDTEIDYRPRIVVEKTDDLFNSDQSADSDGVIDTAGDVIKYTVTVRNEGNVTLSSISLTDALIANSLDKNDDDLINVADAVGGDDGNGLLDVGESWVFTGEYEVKQADIDNRGNFDSNDIDQINDDVMRNVAAVTSKSSDQQNLSSDVFVDTRLIYGPELEITKTANVSQVIASGDEIVYTVTVENRGNVTLTNVVVTDPLSGLTQTIDSLAPGSSESFEASYMATQEDFDTRGGGDDDIDNTAQADSDQTDAVTASYAVELLRLPELWITKTANVSQVDASGDEIVYTVTVENRGNVTLTNVVVTDPLSGLTQTIDSLAPGGSESFEASYMATQEDFDTRGGGDDDIDNTAQADSDQTDAVTASYAVELLRLPELWITKTANVSQVIASGDEIVYTVTVENRGNVTLTNVVVTDPLSGLTQTIDSLAPGSSESFEASYMATQEDFDTRGGGDDDIDNTAQADSDQTDAVTASYAVGILYDPELSVLKQANVESVDEVGDKILYTISVSNTGNITLTDVTLEDTLIEDSLSNDADQDGVIDGDDGDGLLEVDETWIWTGEYTVTQADYDAALETPETYYIRNTATADSDQTDPVTSSEEVSLVEVAFEGLSPGYWKNHPEDWDGISTITSFENFFFGSQQSGLKWMVKSPGKGKEKFVSQQDISMEQALELTGGAEAALARQAVAAVLNTQAEDVTYRFTEAQIKEWVTEALSGMPVDLENDGMIEFQAGSQAIEGVKNLLDYNNNLELI